MKGKQIWDTGNLECVKKPRQLKCFDILWIFEICLQINKKSTLNISVQNLHWMRFYRIIYGRNKWTRIMRTYEAMQHSNNVPINIRFFWSLFTFLYHTKTLSLGCCTCTIMCAYKQSEILDQRTRAFLWDYDFLFFFIFTYTICAHAYWISITYWPHAHSTAKFPVISAGYV